MKVQAKRVWVALAVLAGFGLVLLGAAAARVQWTTDPERDPAQAFDFEAMLLRVDEVRFPSVDGVALSGWFVQGTPSRPPILLCHDFGRSKADLVNLAIELNLAGFPVMLFDFRGHGASEGSRSTLGLKEKRDILGAVEHLIQRGVAQGRIGIYGVGMGAHAAVLAAADRRALRVLVLDGLYPQAGYRLVRTFWEDWEFGVRHLPSVPEVAFALMNGIGVADQRAAEVLPHLLGRDLLLLAPAGDPTLVEEMQSMYRQIPEQREVDGNLIVLPATQSVGLYGEDLDRHQEKVIEFFRTRLGP